MFGSKTGKQCNVWTLEQMMEAITGGTWKKELEEIRALHAAGETEKAAARKGELPYVTYSGIFEGGHKATQLKEYSHYMTADFDNVEKERLEEYLMILIDVPWVAAAFVSPLWGLKAIAVTDCDAEHHKAAYRQVMAKLEEITGLKADPACSDVCRGHFVSYSPTGWYRADATALHIEPEESIGKGGIPPLKATDPKQPCQKPKNRKPISPKQAQRLMQEAMEQINKRMDYSLHQRNTYVYQLMRIMNRKGVDRETAATLATALFDLSETEINQTVNSAYTHTEEFATEQEHEKGQVELIEEYLGKHFVLRKNIVLCQVEFLRKGEEEKDWRPMTDYEENSILRSLWLSSFKVRASTLHNLLGGDYVELFDPFQSYMDSLPPWDGVTDYIGQVAATVQTTDQPAFEKDFRKWMVATVAGWIMPDVCNETVLAFTGAQGTYKSSFLRSLTPPPLQRYTNTVPCLFDCGDKDARMNLAQCGVINLEEVEAMSRREQAQFKTMLTIKSVNERLPYGRNKEVMPRRAAFTASTNMEEVLNDLTGYRRWTYHKVLRISSPYTYPFPYEGVYAQAYALLKQGFRYWYEGDEITELNQRNAQFKAASIEEEMLATCFRKPAEGESYEMLTTTQVMEQMMLFLHTSMSLVKIGMALQHAGYEFVWHNGVRKYKVKQLDFTDININKHRLE